ncbi:unnamed protein product (macronuclear) [Paramecium tetraurelia]|uniref:Uncharacterized protein n=1 Tax=Paramecium tetraurelia TaxID=5888 RepID=A0C4V7_PARTE|nr:uncharacterized protein GSPATT00006323001 [Paramecium tetraurelia]CAK65824.1 unnamed protein product [Paramecium tetraurelia]|eukprot:XP_001433221.1 hypothetical protein (macronuclear) [Paramecium tetraurelia strain d4-2]
MIYSQHPYEQPINYIPQGYPMYYEHYQPYQPPFEHYQILSNVIPITEPIQSTIILPKETVIERHVPVQKPKQAQIENPQKEKRKNFFNLDNNPYLFSSARIKNYQQQQPTQGYQQSNDLHQIQLQTNRLESTQRVQEPQIQSVQQKNLRESQSARIFYPPQPIQQQSIYHQIDQNPQTTQYYPTSNIQQSKILEQKDYIIQQQKPLINEEVPPIQTQSLHPQYQATAQFQQQLSKSLFDQPGRQLKESKSHIIQSTIEYNAPKQRPGINVDLNLYKSSSQSLSQSKLRRSKIFD